MVRDGAKEGFPPGVNVHRSGPLGPSLSMITYCMGRRAQAEVMVPSTLALLSPGDEVVLVDYGDPDNVGGWAVGLGARQLTVVKVSGVRWFHMDHARNVGARAAVCDVLVFADVDFVLTAAVVAELRTIGEREFLGQSDRTHSLGFVACWREHCVAVQGHEEAVCGYGMDDIAFRNTLSACGLGRRIMAAMVEKVTVGTHCRNLQSGNIGLNASVNARVLRALRSLDARRNNVGRNWGWGGEIVKRSEANREETEIDNDAALWAANSGPSSVRADVADLLQGG